MRLLLDTHVLLWAINEPERLSLKVRRMLLDEGNELFASVVSIWEIIIKVRAGRLEIPVTVGHLQDRLKDVGIKAYVPIELFHVYRVAKLPPLHSDPFDRMLLAQASVENLTLVSKDKALSQYDPKVLW